MFERHGLPPPVGALALPTPRDEGRAKLAGEVLLRFRSRGGRRARDWTFVALAGAIVLALNLGSSAAHDDATSLHGGWAAAAAGFALIASGATLRLWAVHELGRFFKGVVVIQEGHRVVRTGPYRLLRHPSYTGGLIAFLGIGVAFDDWLSIVALVVPPLIGILVRVHMEEAALTAALEDEYRDYAAHTRRLVPCIW
jgi:protein-S-isoprenylcysteine O-methyltransferase Ste14